MLHLLSEAWKHLAALSWLELSNGVVALAGACAAGNAIFMSMDSSTSRAMRCGYVTLTVGLFGQAASIVVHSWQLGYDALLFGGSLALFLGSRRQAQFMPMPAADLLSIVVMFYGWGVFFLSVQ